MYVGPINQIPLRVLNSKLNLVLMKNRTNFGNGSILDGKSLPLNACPYRKITAAEQRPFIQLVERILSAKAADPTADTSEQEAEIDRLVYTLYGLTEEEVAAVEGKS